jgi:hypothetical protein
MALSLPQALSCQSSADAWTGHPQSKKKMKMKKRTPLGTAHEMAVRRAEKAL